MTGEIKLKRYTSNEIYKHYIFQGKDEAIVCIIERQCLYKRKINGAGEIGQNCYYYCKILY